MEATQEELDRFMSYVDKLPNGCWFWTGGRSRGKGNRKWYGSFWFRGKSIRAHRFSADYIGRFEPLPPGKHRDHTCVFSMCVNPEHLEHVTHEVNQERKVERWTQPIDERAPEGVVDLERGCWTRIPDAVFANGVVMHNGRHYQLAPDGEVYQVPSPAGLFSAC